MREQGLTLGQIGARLGCSRAYVGAILKHGTGKTPARSLTERHRQALRLRRQGLKFREVGERLGVTVGWAHRLVREAERLLGGEGR